METNIKVNSKMAEGMDMAPIQPTVLNTKATGWMIIQMASEQSNGPKAKSMKVFSKMDVCSKVCFCSLMEVSMMGSFRSVRVNSKVKGL